MGSSQYDQTSSKRKGRRREHKPKQIVTWLDIHPEILRRAVSTVAGAGGCLRLGYTRDQGAYAIGIYGEGDPYTEYYHSVDDVVDFLRELIRDYGDDIDIDAILASKA